MSTRARRRGDRGGTTAPGTRSRVPAAPDPDGELTAAVEALGRKLSTLAGTSALTAVVELLDGAVAAAGLSRSTCAPAIEAEPGTPGEALAMLSMLAQTRTRLSALTDTWLLEAAARIRAVNAAEGKAGRRLDDGVTSNIAVAQRTSIHAASHGLSSARRLATAMPRTRAAKRTGRLPEATVLAITRELTGESEELCAQVDADLARDPARLDGLGEKKVREVVADLVAKHTTREESAERVTRAVRDRHVHLTPLPHGTCRLTAILPALAGAQIDAVLQAAAESARAGGSRTPLGAARADMLLEAVNYYADALSEDPPFEVAPRPAPEDDWVSEADAQAAGAAVLGDVTELLAQARTDARPGTPEAGTADPPGPAADPGSIATLGHPAAATPDGPSRPMYPPGPPGSARGPDLAGGAKDADATTGERPRARAAQRPSGKPRLRRPVSTPRGPRIEVGIIITDRALLGRDEDNEYATLTGYGIAPAHALIRDLAGGNDPVTTSEDQQDARAEAHRVRMFYRRLYTHPTSGELVAMDSASRAFPQNLRRMILGRDHTCRAPYCNAASRHIDHIDPHAAGGPTSLANGQGCCAQNNYDKETAVWTTQLQDTPARPGATQVTWTSPHGATGTSRTPASHRVPSTNRAERRAHHRSARLAARSEDRTILSRKSTRSRRSAPGAGGRARRTARRAGS